MTLRIGYRSKTCAQKGQSAFEGLPIRVGSDPRNDLVVAHTSVGHFHARIERIGNDVCLRVLPGQWALAEDGARIPPNVPIPLAKIGFRFALGSDFVFVIVPGKPAIAQKNTSLQILKTKSAPRGPSSGSASATAREAPAPPKPMTIPGHAVGLPLPPPAFRPTLPPPASESAVASPSSGGWAPTEQRGGGSSSAKLPVLDSVPYRQGPAPTKESVESWEGVGDQKLQSASAKRGRPSAQRLDAMTEGAMERMALAGLQELAASLVPGARLENEADVGALITRLHDTMEMFCRTVAPVLDEHRAFLEEYGLRMANEEHDDAEEDDPTGEVPQERRVDPVLLARRLLDWRAGGVAFHKTFERQLGAFHGHSEALVSATLRGIDHLLQEFSPESLDERMDRGGHHGVAFVVNPRRAFRAIYEDHYRHVAEERRLAQVLLGPAFARRYHAARSQGSKS